MSKQKTLQEKLDAIAKFTLMDDTFFEAFADDIKAVQEMLRVILNDENLIVLKVYPQKQIRNLYGRSVRLDAICKLGDGRIVEIEIQNEDNDNHVKRVFFNAAQIMVHNSQTGTNFDELPYIIVVFISKFDPFGDGLQSYHPELVIRETGKVINDGTEFIFVNAGANDGSRLARLMKCMQEREVNDPSFPEITRRFHQLKHEEEGVIRMCKVMEEYTKECRAEALAQGEANGKILGQIKVYHNEMHLTPQEIAEKLDVTEEKVREVIAAL